MSTLEQMKCIWKEVKKVEEYIKSQPAPTGDKNFAWVMETPSYIWLIEHNLKKKPSVTVMDSNGNEFRGAVQHLSIDELTVTFNIPFAGQVTLN